MINQMSDFYGYNRPGIAAIISSQNVFIFTSSNLLSYISRLIVDNTSYKDWSIEIIETWNHWDSAESQLSLRAAYLRYEELGYNIVDKRRRLVCFAIQKVLEGDQVSVYLVNRYHQRLVGKFETMELAQLFIDKYYKPGYTKIIEKSEHDLYCSTSTSEAVV